jgi:LmbE family N-acetylglucosaminyl deacetylase|tara:strand:+ start:1081 stop:1794 length:714 start_codon:yes stop_codon:yes gene_type:complete
MNIVSVGAHQDDIELNCLGTLIKYASQPEVTITNVVVSNGDKGGSYDLSISDEEVATMRRNEATAVAEALGGRYVCMGQSDEYIRDTDEARNALTDILRAARADVVFGPPPVDYNTDHMISSQIVFHACLLTAVGPVRTEHEPLKQVPVLYYMDTITGLDWQPTHYVDISEVFERKCELLRLHKSQMENMAAIGGWDLVKYSQVVNAFRGVQCGAEYAEGFKPALAWPRVRPGNVLP